MKKLKELFLNLPQWDQTIVGASPCCNSNNFMDDNLSIYYISLILSPYGHV